VSAYPLVGFTLDKTGASSYVGDIASGYLYTPQNLLQSFTAFEDNVKTIGATTRETAYGAVEVVSYGQVQYMECVVEPITDYVPQLSIKENANAVSEFRDFMTYCITKAPIEFIPNILVPTVFKKCLLEKTAESSKGVDFKIKENKKLFNWFQSGPLVFRGLE